MERRRFISILSGGLLASAVPSLAQDGQKRKVSIPGLNVRKIRIEAGARRPFGALQISDTHIARADKRDDDRKIALAASRQAIFPWAEHCLDLSIAYARDRGLIMLHTGDMIDFVSEANLDCAAAHFGMADWIACCGNHEFSKYVGEAREDEAYKNDSLRKVEEAYPGCFDVSSRIIEDVNFVTLDDVYYNVTREQMEKVEREFRKGLPIILMCHVPFYTPEFCKYSLEQNGGRCAYLTGCPLEVTSRYEQDPSRPQEEQWRNRSVQQRADGPTLEFLSYLKEQELLRAILTGHCHTFYQERFSRTAVQYTVGANYQGDAYEIEFV